MSESIDGGYREPLLNHAPAFAELHNDPLFQALVARNRRLIEGERARFGLKPLS